MYTNPYSLYRHGRKGSAAPEGGGAAGRGGYGGRVRRSNAPSALVGGSYRGMEKNEGRGEGRGSIL